MKKKLKIKLDGSGNPIIVQDEIPNDEIWYTSSDGNVVTPHKTNVFGINIVSNTYADGKGIIKFDGDVTSIGNYAFDSCSGLTSITIPNSVTSIGGSAFGDCSKLAEVICLQTTPPSLGSGVFSSTSSSLQIKVPAESVDIYKTATNWSAYADKIVSQ